MAFAIQYSSQSDYLFAPSRHIFIFILPTETYFDVFRTQSYLGKRLFRRRRGNNTVSPAPTRNDQSLKFKRNKNLIETIELHEQPKTPN